MRRLDLTMPHWFVLALEWPPGQVLYLSTRPGVIPQADRDITLLGGLPALRWRQEVPIGGIAIGQGGLTVEADLGDLYAAQAVERPLEGVRAELSVVMLGQAWDERLPLLHGVIDRAVLGVQGQPASLEIVEQVLNDGGVLGNDPILLEDWPDMNANAVDEIYPLVIGAPGRVVKATETVLYPGSPAWVVRDVGAGDPITTVIAGHPVVAQTVTMFNITTGVSDTRAVSTTTVGTGSVARDVATVNLYPLSDFGGGATVDDEWWTSWSHGGALADAGGVEAISGAGQALEVILARATMPVDLSRVAAARGHLDAYRVATYINRETSPWMWVRAAILPVISASARSGPDGVSLVPWELPPRREQAVLHLVIGENATRASMDEPGDVERCTRAEVSFAYNTPTGEWERTVVVGPSTPSTGDEGITAYTARAQLQGEPVHTVAVELDAVADEGTAWRVAERMTFLGHRPPRLVEIDVDPDLAGLELGDTVTITDDLRGWVRQVALVYAVEWASAYVRVGLFVVYQ